MQQKTLAESIASALKLLTSEELASMRDVAWSIIFHRENAITEHLKKFTEIAA